MPRFLAIGHVTRDCRPDGDVLGGSASYAALTAARLGWDVGVLTAAGPDFEPERELPGISVFVRRSAATTRFVNIYAEDGARRQVVTSRADDIDLEPLPDEWREPDALLLSPVAGELDGFSTASLEAGSVGAVAQGWLREIDAGGDVSAATVGPAPPATCSGSTSSFSPSRICRMPTLAPASCCGTCPWWP